MLEYCSLCKGKLMVGPYMGLCYCINLLANNTNMPTYLLHGAQHMKWHVTTKISNHMPTYNKVLPF